MKNSIRHQVGASLIEVLIAILILSFGMLALGGMLSVSVQLPKLSGYRATATILASSHVERIRANPDGFTSGSYVSGLNETSDWSFSPIALSSTNCKFTGGTQCTSTTLATADINEFRNAVRRELPAGDTIVKCSDSPCLKTSYGEVTVVWQEPSTPGALDASSADNCPSEVTTLYASPKPTPRCLNFRFKVQ